MHEKVYNMRKTETDATGHKDTDRKKGAARRIEVKNMVGF